MAEAILNGLLSGGLYAIIAVGLSLVFGVMGLVNLAHGDIMVVGAYLASLLVGALHIDPLLSLVAVVPVVMLLAYPLQRFVLTGLLRRGLEPPLVATFGVSLLISSALAEVFGGDARSLDAPYASSGFSVAGLSVPTIGAITLAIAVVLVVAAHLAVARTQFGAALRAASADPTTAGMMGIDVQRVYAVTFAAAAGFAAVAGVLIGVGYSFGPTTGTGYLLIGFTVVVLGGTAGVLGSLWGGLAIGVIQSVGSTLLGGQYRDLVVYVAFLVILLLAPSAARLRRALPRRRPAIPTPIAVSR